MDLDNILPGEISRSEKDRYHTIALLYIESKEQTELTSKIGTDSYVQNRMTAIWGKVRGWRD